MRSTLTNLIELVLFLGTLWVLAMVAVAHADVVVPEREVVAAVRDYALRTVEGGADVEVSCRWRGDLTVEGVGPVTLRACPSKAEGSAGGLPVSLEVRRGSKVMRNLLITAEVAYYDTVAVAARPLRHGEALTPDAVRFERREVTQMLERTFSRPEDLDGLQARTALPAGRVLDRRLTEGMTLIRRGEAVTILAGMGTVTISTSGRALSDGAAGDCIFVENGERQKIQGKVIKAGTVRVVF